ncbi:hypothetical protein B7R22_06415 [Subtercola boreus]|uniref:Uncharacterized protein n=1 Tax=Subtercola boreus TaxID=120213 RepID=A0A3E0W0Q8_9MICO|nr:hypothetical protein [Subtercola boreus]RFA15581.1 hypothetical protein B7R22_06415 [Subtercola boreus]
MTNDDRATSTSASVRRLSSVAESQAAGATDARVGVSRGTRIAAARARRTADVKRGKVTPPWIIELAESAG